MGLLPLLKRRFVGLTNSGVILRFGSQIDWIDMEPQDWRCLSGTLSDSAQAEVCRSYIETNYPAEMMNSHPGVL